MYNPQLHQIWKLGPYDYYAPKVCGAGKRAQYQENLMRTILESANGPKVLKMVAELAMARKTVQRTIPDHLKEEVMTEEVLNERYGEVVNAFMISSQYSYVLVLLETLLTPCDGSPSVKDGFDSATEFEVKAINNFFFGNGTNKTKKETTSSIASPKRNKVKAEQQPVIISPKNSDIDN